jgi:hypothetical protein
LAFLVLALLVVGSGVAFELANASQALAAALPEALARVVVLIAFSGVGAVILAQQPHNRIGWLFCVSSFLMASGICAVEYAVYALRTAPSILPGAVGLALYGSWSRDEGLFAVLTLLPLIFPTGRLPSAGWRVVAWLAIGVQAAHFVGTVFTQFTAADDVRLVGLHNPLSPVDMRASAAIQDPIFLAIIATCFLCGISLFTRMRLARGVERQQFKWFVYAVFLSLTLAGFIFAALLAGVWTAFPTSVWLSLIVSIPLGTGVAILRYRLFDIDVIIRRTLIYGTLTAILAALYFGVVVTAQFFGERLTGQARPPAWLIVVTTLVMAALFTPLRRRVQRVIDRRFYRSRYDAARTIEGFAATLRTETNLGQLSDHLVGVVRETMQPATVSLWLKPAPPVERT